MQRDKIYRLCSIGSDERAGDLFISVGMTFNTVRHNCDTPVFINHVAIVLQRYINAYASLQDMVTI